MREWRTSFKVPIYDAAIFLVVTDDVEYSKQIIPRRIVVNTIEEDNTGCAGLFMYYERSYAILMRRRMVDSGLIDHEIGHCCRQILADIGHKLKAENDECLAYLEGWMTSKVHRLLFKGGKMIR